jgi:hypothetical protein
MQDLETLNSKTIIELREIGKALGIKGALKKQELIDRIIAATTASDQKPETTPVKPSEASISCLRAM